MSPYALHIGLAVVVIVVALGAWVILHNRASIRQYWKNLQNDDYIRRSDLERSLDNLRRELQHSIEVGQAAARQAADIGKKTIAALKPIESALRDFNNRITELEARTDAGEKLWAERSHHLESTKEPRKKMLTPPNGSTPAWRLLKSN